MEFKELQNAVKIIGKYRRCNDGFSFGCGCGQLHEFYYQCSFHNKQMIQLADTLHSDTPESELLIEKLWGVKLVRGKK